MFGYVGGGLLLAIHLVVIMLFQDTDHADLITRLAIASVGLWWFGWSIWTFISVPEPKIANMNKDSTSLGITIKESFIGLSNTLKDIKHYKVVGIYLIAYLLFNDGIQTVLTVAGAFASILPAPEGTNVCVLCCRFHFFRKFAYKTERTMTMFCLKNIMKKIYEPSNLIMNVYALFNVLTLSY